jgi:hypothetical protein
VRSGTYSPHHAGFIAGDARHHEPADVAASQIPESLPELLIPEGADRVLELWIDERVRPEFRDGEHAALHTRRHGRHEPRLVGLTGEVTPLRQVRS